MENALLVLAFLVLALVVVALAALLFGPAAAGAADRRVDRRSDWW